MTGTPLHRYLTRLPREKRPPFFKATTACHRCYVGTWEFRNGMLTLVELAASLLVNERSVEADLRTVLPWIKGVLPATWFSGGLCTQEGRLVHYVHAGFASRYERTRWFGIDKGRVTSEYLEVHPPAPLVYRIDADGKRHARLPGSDQDEADPLEGRPLSDAYLVWGKKPEFEPEDEAGYRVMGEYRRWINGP